MKNLYKYLLAVATVAMAFTSCSKDEFSNPSTETQKVTFTVTSGSDLETPPASRTEFDEETGQMNWSADGEALEVIQILDTINAHATTEAYTIENRVAKFQVSFKALTGSEPYDLTYSAIYPAVNYSGNTNDYTKFRIKLPAEQTPTETGFDPNADLLLAKPETRTAQPAEGEELNFRFKRVAAIAKMTLKGIPAGEKLAKVELTASQPMAGYSRTNLKTGEIYDIGYYKEETMTLTLNDRETTGEDVIWFTSLPCVFGEGDSFTVKAYTDKATYEKTVSFSTPEAFKFVSGGLTRFGITGMTRTENVVDEYVLLTNVADLSVGDQIIITSGTDGAVKAISTTQNNNNRGATDIEIASNTITTIPANAQIITMETGMVANTFAFHVEGDVTGYLYAASSSKNYLKTQDNIDGNASWTIDVAESGVATIEAQGDYTHKLLQYNNSNKLFSCYSNKQQDVYIFHKAGSPKTALETPTGVEAVAEGNEVLVGWKPVAGATSYTVSFEPATIEPRTVLHDDATAEYSELFEGLDYATEYTVSVVANPADTENYKASAPATATFTTGEDPNQTITPIGKITTEGNYTAEGTVVARGSQAYIIADNTGAMMVYHNGNERAVGEKISISGAVELYSNANGSSKSTPQFTNTATVKVLSTDNVWTYNPTAMDGTAMDALLSGELVCQEVQFEGNLEISGNFMNVTIPGASTAIGSIKYVETSTVEAYNGKDIIVKGYYVGYSSNKYVNVLPYSIEEAGGSTDPEPDPDMTPIGEITTEGTYKTEGTVVARGRQAYIIADNTGAMMVYHNGNERSVGEKISISGEVTLYNAQSTPQFSASAEVEVLSTGNSWSYNPAQKDGAAMDALLSGTPVCTEIAFQGNLAISGNYVNVTIPGASTAIGSVKYIDNSTVAAYDGKDVIVKGYFVGTSSSKYVNVLPYSVEEANPSTDPAIKADPTSLSFAAAGESKEVTYTAENLGENQVFAAVSGENASQFSATVGNGTVTVTAAENTETTAKTATLTLYIAASEGGEHLAEATVALTQAGVSSGNEQTVTLSFAGGDAQNHDEIPFTEGNITATFTKGDHQTSPRWDATCVRFYGTGGMHNQLTVSGATITKIEFIFNGSYDTAGMTADSGTISGSTWTGSSDNVVFTAGNKQTRIEGIIVTYN